ncbi:MAG TPA: hypothetical protein VHS58_16670 [Acetobacteraceae bacterium]|nr:hypothetical protein [Acetobacteraceae bacterium]
MRVLACSLIAMGTLIGAAQAQTAIEPSGAQIGTPEAPLVSSNGAPVTANGGLTRGIGVVEVQPFGSDVVQPRFDAQLPPSVAVRTGIAPSVAGS